MDRREFLAAAYLLAPPIIIGGWVIHREREKTREDLTPVFEKDVRDTYEKPYNLPMPPKVFA